MADSLSDRIATLAGIPLFSYLGPEELKEAQTFFVEETRRKGDVICKAGEAGDTFYIVLSGELEVWGGEGADVLITRLGPRDFFGELALVVGEPRSATVIVSQRARLLTLSKESFHRFFLKNPKVLEYFSRVICQRLSAAASGDHAATELSTFVVSVTSQLGLRGKTMVATALAALLKDFSEKEILLVYAEPLTDLPRDDRTARVLRDSRASREEIRKLLDLRGGEPARLRVGIKPGAERAEHVEMFCNLVARLSNDFTYIVLDLGAEPAALLASIGDYTDLLIRIVNRVEPASGPYRTMQVINLYNPASKRVPINSCEPFVLPRDHALDTDPDTQLQRLRQRPALSSAVPLHRLARKILGKTVGVALGGGAAFGLSHLGVLKVFEEHNIPVDLLAGCSMGSLVAIGYAAEVGIERLIKLANELGRRRRLFNLLMRDSTFLLTKPGILSGDGIRAIFTPYLGSRLTFEHLTIPCRVVATDIDTGERVELCTGKLPEAFRASCSVPVVMSPVKYGGRVLVDGGVCDPVPAEVVRAMGADICVGVNVVPPMKKGVESMITRVYRQLNMFNPLAHLSGSVDLPNLFDVAMNSIQTLQYELGNFKMISADVRINPDLSDFTWVEFFRDEELIAKGIEAAENALPAIYRALSGKEKESLTLEQETASRRAARG